MDTDNWTQILAESKEWRDEVSKYLEKTKKTNQNNTDLRAKANAIFKQENAQLRKRLAMLEKENKKLYNTLIAFDNMRGK